MSGKKTMGKGMFFKQGKDKVQSIRKAVSVGHDEEYNELVKEKMGKERTGDGADGE